MHTSTHVFRFAPVVRNALVLEQHPTSSVPEVLSQYQYY